MDIEILTPEAVLTGLAFNFGSNTWQDKKGKYRMIHRNLLYHSQDTTFQINQELTFL